MDVDRLGGGSQAAVRGRGRSEDPMDVVAARCFNEVMPVNAGDWTTWDERERDASNWMAGRAGRAQKGVSKREDSAGGLVDVSPDTCLDRDAKFVSGLRKERMEGSVRKGHRTRDRGRTHRTLAWLRRHPSRPFRFPRPLITSQWITQGSPASASWPAQCL